MKNCFIICISVFLLFSNSYATKIKNNSVNAINYSLVDTSGLNLLSYSKTDLQKILGRNLTWKEKIGLSLYKKKLLKADPTSEALTKKANSYANWGFWLSIAGLAGFFLWGFPILLSIPAYVLSHRALEIEKKSPGTLKEGNLLLAKFGKVISLVTGILFILLLILLIVILSSGGLKLW